LIWDELKLRIKDETDNANNRFVVAGEFNVRCAGSPFGPYWGCPNDRQFLGLSIKSPPFPYRVDSGLVLERKRESERRLPGVLSSWQLWGAGAVGSQTLLGIPEVAGLRDDPEFAAISRVWPFETGFDMEPGPLGTPFILHAEIWPGIVKHPFDPALTIPDQAGVRAMVTWLADLDAENRLLPLFRTPPGLAGDTLKQVVEEEGWIFGTGT
jgi:precorrin-8X/cobalt-precorrin-8 methylmutase